MPRHRRRLALLSALALPAACGGTDPMPLVTRGLTNPDYEVVPLEVQPSYTSSDTTVMRVVARHLQIVGFGRATLTATMPATAPAGADIATSILVVAHE